MYQRKRKDLNIGPCGTLVLIDCFDLLTHCDVKIEYIFIQCDILLLLLLLLLTDIQIMLNELILGILALSFKSILKKRKGVY